MSEPKFKIGDKVRVVDEEGNVFTKRDVLIVVEEQRVPDCTFLDGLQLAANMLEMDGKIDYSKLPD